MNSINVDDLYTDISNYNALLYNKKRKLDEAIRTNEEHDKLEAKLNKVKDVRCKLERHSDELKLYLKLTKKEDTNYKEMRTHFIESQVEESLLKIFPTRNYKIKLKRKLVRNKIRVNLTLENKFGDVSSPSDEGKLCRQLINFGASTAMSKSYKLDKVFSDESFTASSPENLTKVGNIVKDLVDNGMQVILVEQQDTIYKDLSRREILIEIDPITLDVKEPKIADY